jgi:hypothetical protein
MIQTSFVPQGWECPKCKRVYSPTTSMCSHCPEHSQGYTSTGTTFSVGTSTTFIGHNFEPDKKGSSKTKCKICGLEKFQHPLISYT